MPLPPEVTAPDLIEAYEHGMTQGRLEEARDGLSAILRMATGSSKKMVKIRTEAERSLRRSAPKNTP